MARGEGRPEGSSILAGLASLTGNGYSGSRDLGGEDRSGPPPHRSLEEAFVKEPGGGLNLRGFVQEDFSVVFDEVRSGEGGGTFSFSFCCSVVGLCCRCPSNAASLT